MATKTAFQRLQKQMVCRRPTDADLRVRAPIVVTERDQELLVDVYRHGFLTTDLIELAYFPSDAQRRSRSSCCYDRLKLLWLWNYVDRIELPVAVVAVRELEELPLESDGRGRPAVAHPERGAAGEVAGDLAKALDGIVQGEVPVDELVLDHG